MDAVINGVQLLRGLTQEIICFLVMKMVTLIAIKVVTLIPINKVETLKDLFMQHSVIYLVFSVDCRCVICNNTASNPFVSKSCVKTEKAILLFWASGHREIQSTFEIKPIASFSFVFAQAISGPARKELSLCFFILCCLIPSFDLDMFPQILQVWETPVICFDSTCLGIDM